MSYILGLAMIPFRDLTLFNCCTAIVVTSGVFGLVHRLIRL